MLRSLAARLRRARWALGVGILLSLPTLGVGWFYDDLVHRAVLDDAVPGYHRGPLELYEFVHEPETVVRLRDAGRLPWFTDPDVAIRFFRPLPSALRALEHSLFRGEAWPSHLLSVLLFVVWLGVVFGLLEEVDPERAALATLIFACAGAHSLAIGWVAARYALLVGIFATLALGSYLRAARGGTPWWSAAWLILALLCGESALAALSFIGAHVVCDRSSPLRTRLRAAAPPALIGSVFVALYASAGYGARGSALYLSPMRSPLAFLAEAPERFAILLADLSTSLPSGVLYLQPLLRPYGWVVGVVGVAILAVATRLSVGPAHRRRLAWLWLGGGGSLLAATAAIPEGRLIGLASLAGAATLAAVLQHAWRMLTRRDPRRPLVLGLALLLAASAFVTGPLVRLGLTLGQAGLSVWHRRIEAPAWPDAPPGPRYAFLLNSDDVMLWFYAPITMPSGARLVPLGTVPGAVSVVAIDDHTLELRSDGDAGILDSPLAGLLRDRPLAASERVDLGELVVEVREPAPSLRARFTFDAPIHSPRYQFLEWDGSALVAVRLEPGVPRRLAYLPGPSSAPPP